MIYVSIIFPCISHVFPAHDIKILGHVTHQDHRTKMFCAFENQIFKLYSPFTFILSLRIWLSLSLKLLGVYKAVLHAFFVVLL